MNKKDQEKELRNLLINPTLESGLYLIDTDLNDEEIESFIKEICVLMRRKSYFSHQKALFLNSL